MWDSDIELGCVVMYALGLIGSTLIVAALFIGHAVGDLGVALFLFACTLAVIHDNQRTRRMLARPGEKVAPMRRD